MMNPRTSHNDFKVQMQVHSKTGFPQILYESQQEDDQKSISLEPGYEYEIILDPYGQVSTEAFKALSLDERGCRLKHELHNMATHPTYSTEHCKFDCHVNMAFETCKCVPWDFVTNVNDAIECDLFGRTCFFNVVESLTHGSDDNCSHCQLERCDYVMYRKTILKSTSLTLKRESEGMKSNKYVTMKGEEG